MEVCDVTTANDASSLPCDHNYTFCSLLMACMKRERTETREQDKFLDGVTDGPELMKKNPAINSCSVFCIRQKVEAGLN